MKLARATEKTRIQLCGRLSIEIDGVQLASGLRGKQVPLLLVYLLLNRTRHVGRDELIGALWPRVPPQSQDAALRTLLSRLRSALGPEVLTGRDELTLQLPEPVWIDVEAALSEMQRAQEALAQGDSRTAWALAQVPLNIARRGLLPGAQAEWLEPRRRELQDIRLEALETIGRAGMAMGGTQVASVERAARTLIEAEPYRESGYVLLMEALAAQGNVAEGLRVFEQLRLLLREELGTMPSVEAMAVHQRLLTPQQLVVPTSIQEEQQQGVIELPGDLVARTAEPLVGRRREMEELEGLWVAAEAHSAATKGPETTSMPGRIVVLVGDPGIGKSRLVAELARRVHRNGAVVLAGRAPQEALVPYQPFLEALRHYVARAPLSELRTNTREYGPELARLVPDLRRRVPGLPPPPEGEPETERYRLFEAVVGLLGAISQSTPVLLVLDDLHWADRPSLLLLRHLARAVATARLLIIGAFRADESRDAASDAVADLRREQLVTNIEVPGLSERETAQLVCQRTNQVPSRAFSKALHAETEGNPFFIEELLRHLTEAGVNVGRASASQVQRAGLPEGIRDVIARRVARLDSQAMECLRVAAVIGREFDVALLERVVSLEEEEFLNALDVGLATGLVEEAQGKPGCYSFSHALVRETLYEGMSLPRRARFHRRVGEALEHTGKEPQVGALAHHFTLAAGSENAEKAIRYARAAGQSATAVLAHEEAAEHYSRALEVIERFQPEARELRLELLLELAEARVRSGERAAARPAFRDAATLADKLGDTASLARAAIGAARRYVQEPGVVDTELIAMLRRALEMTSKERTLTRVRLLARLCGALYYSDQREQMEQLSEEAGAIASELGDPEAAAYACAARRRTLWSAENLGQRLETSTEMLTAAQRIGNRELELQAHAWLVVDLLEHGDREGVDAQIEAFAMGAEQVRQPLYLWNAIVFRTMRALLAGRITEAEELAIEALAAGAPSESVTAPQYYAIQLIAIRREQLRIGELEAAAREMVARNPARHAWRAAMAALLVEIGRIDEARAELEPLAAKDFADIPHDGDWMTAMTLLADVCSDLGDAERAALIYHHLLPHERSNVVIGIAALCLGSASRYLGKLAAAMGREDDALRHFDLALEANASLGSPLWLAHTQLDCARAVGDPARAEELIDAAARTAAELDLPLVSWRARELAPL